MTPTFWKYSVITKPTDRKIECHGTAYDFLNTFDFRYAFYFIKYKN
jgi:hypothetical protein